MVHLAAFTDPHLLDQLLAAFLRAMRVFTFVTGALVVVDSTGLLFGLTELPPHRPRANALGWLLCAGISCLSSGWLLAHQVVWVKSNTGVADKLATSMMWVGFGIAFTIRAVTRAKRPWITATSAALICIFGTLLAFVSPVP